jgi:hypothetical protein
VLNPNPPKLVTVVIALALVLVGLSATVFPIDFVNEALAALLQAAGFEFRVTTELGWLFLFGGNVLLVAGSLLPGI